MINLHRGNSAVFSLTLTNADGTIFIPSEKDTVLFTVKKSQTKGAKELILKRITPSDNMIISFEPLDTINLPEGDYYYDVAVCIGGTEFYTAVSDDFKILPALGEMEMVKYARH